MNTPTDEKIIKAFLSGSVNGLVEPNIKPEHIQTQISHIFLFQKTAYKLYRKDNDNFNKLFVDLGGSKLRKEFYEEDFFWNNYFNNKVYKNLLGINTSESSVELTSDNKKAYDLIIQMQRIDASHNLTTILQHGILKEEDMRIIGYEMTKAIAEFPRKLKSNRNYFEIMEILLDDLEGFSWLADPLIPKQKTDKIMKVLREYSKKHKEEFSKLTQKDFVIAIDNHSDNVFYNNGEVSFIDVYLPKDDWRIVEPQYSIYRLSADVRVLAGEKFSNALIQGYRDFYENANLNKGMELFYQIYSALIKGAYLCLIYKENNKRKDEADKYLNFIEKNLGKVNL